ncbi:hypothetical protein M3Y96_01254800 [Aphelenchoides besseyi]|nr:hypothetical protein M3Y96_01254800 [Aphelenchoides besseyi]
MRKLLGCCVLVFLFVGSFTSTEKSKSPAVASTEWFFTEWRLVFLPMIIIICVAAVGIGVLLSCCCSSNDKKPTPPQNAPEQPTKQPTVQKPAVQKDLFTKEVVTTKDVAPTVALMPVDDDTTIYNIAPIQQQNEKETKTGKEVKEQSKASKKQVKTAEGESKDKKKIDKSPAANPQGEPSKPKANALAPPSSNIYVLMGDVLDTWNSEVDDPNYDPKKRAKEKAEAAVKEKSKKTKKRAAAKCNPNEKTTHRKDDKDPPPRNQEMPQVDERDDHLAHSEVSQQSSFRFRIFQSVSLIRTAIPIQLSDFSVEISGEVFGRKSEFLVQRQKSTSWSRVRFEPTTEVLERGSKPPRRPRDFEFSLNSYCPSAQVPNVIAFPILKSANPTQQLAMEIALRCSKFQNELESDFRPQTQKQENSTVDSSSRSISSSTSKCGGMFSRIRRRFSRSK